MTAFELPIKLPAGLDLDEFGVVSFRNSLLQDAFNKTLDQVTPGTKNLELDARLIEGEVALHVIGLQKSDDGHWTLQEMLGVSFRKGEPLNFEAGFKIRWEE
jgi:hypothetical protein